MNAYKGIGDNSSQQKSKARSRILIAEDDGDTTLTYKTALDKAGYGVIAVDNGEDCAKPTLRNFRN